jgi:hypothetical protein
MLRPRIDHAIHLQLDRLTYLLRDVERSGGRDNWSHLFSHGHKYPTVRSAIRQGKLRETSAYRYELTDTGRQYLTDVEAVRMQSA